MTPTTILKQLDRLRRRERLVRFAWGMARWLAVVVAALTIACSVDWWIDLRRDTPYALRVAMLVGQIALAAALACVWLLIPFVRRRSDDELALFVEESRPEFQHGLISAVQLNRPRAAVAGMSPELIAAAASEAEGHAKKLDFQNLANHSRLVYAVVGIFGLALIGGLAGIIAPATLHALLNRQLLAEVSIPRSFALDNRTVEVWPSGEPATVSIGIPKNEYMSRASGDVRVKHADGTLERHSLAVDGYAEVATLQVSAGTSDFTFEGWLGDGRLKQPGRVHRVPRPAVMRQNAWTLLPQHCGTTPSGKPYAIEQPRGDVAGLPGSSARVQCATQKPVVSAVVELLGTATSGQTTSVAVLRRIPMELQENRTDAIATFGLRPEEVAYRLVVTDEHGFGNTDPPRRGLRIVAEEAPIVALLPEHFAPDQMALAGVGPAEDFEVEGVPIPLGGSIRVAYTASHPFGLGDSRFFYRINEGTWWPYNLKEAPATAASGPFDSRRGAFANSRPGDQIQFHAMPSTDPERRLSRTDGGGRFDFQTRSIPELKVGDRIEFYVEVTNREPGTPKAGRSETRLKAIVTVPQLVQWIDTTLRQEDRIRQLEQRQKGVFSPGGPPK